MYEDIQSNKLTNLIKAEIIKEKNMSKTGEKPGKGTYTCTKCGQKVTLDDNSDKLPPCPSCHGTNYRP
ncbi:MAG: hypothetical protein PF638_05250 [Candidatus Delongbacteria bacterium]|jgi:rubrerythrin|nr:hypothetical protein [Candidatus Delongbacteria bacterium]